MNQTELLKQIIEKQDKYIKLLGESESNFASFVGQNPFINPDLCCGKYMADDDK